MALAGDTVEHTARNAFEQEEEDHASGSCSTGCSEPAAVRTARRRTAPSSHVRVAVCSCGLSAARAAETDACNESM